MFLPPVRFTAVLPPTELSTSYNRVVGICMNFVPLNMTDAKKPVIKTGAEIPFTRYFYKYQKPQASEDLAKQFVELEASVSERIKNLFGDM